MTAPMPDARLAALLDQHMRVVAYLGETNQMPLGARWRLIMGDSYADDCIGPVCPHEDTHQILDDGTPDVRGQYNCCPYPVIECHTEQIAAWLVELLNGAPGLVAELQWARGQIDALRARLAAKEA